MSEPQANTRQESTRGTDPLIRSARPGDYEAILAVADGWWGRPVSALLNRLYLDHFCGTSLIAEEPDEEGDGALAGFVIGFLSPARPELAYIHFTGVAPARRRDGLARELYERFFALAREAGRTEVKAITSPSNTGSIAFHTAIGFSVSEPVPDYDGPGQDRVVFHREL
ncbi:GNAT family N-acetyltransferase [Streptomyces sp. ODS28]|uniref:GNAT family N-acetyltransferase n=1 Tax=Streptomyces sp. ODS28 TaxID=3136688 RepID=UPI0031E82A3F